MRYEIRRADDGSVYKKMRLNDFELALSTFCRLRGNQPEKGLYFISGKQVSIDEAVAAAEADKAAWWEKKNETHKQIKIFVGVCGGMSTNKPLTKWVRRKS